MKHITEMLRYDGSTLKQVHDMLADPAFREKVCEYQHVLSHTVEVQHKGEAMTVTVDQVQVARGIPGFARKFVGDQIHIVATEDWTSPTKGQLHVAIPGKPVEISGTVQLAEDPAGTTETIDLSVHAHVPFVGGKIESLVAGLFGRALGAEHQAGVDWLAGTR